MSEPRRPTTKLGRRRDPRAESVPPGRRLTQPELGAVVVGKMKDPTARVAQLEQELARERAERTAEADLMGQILARATQAEARVRLLEEALARANEERAIAEAQLQSTRAELEQLLADAKATFDAGASLLPAVAGERRSDSRPALQAARSLAAELLQSIDAALGRDREPTSQRARVPTLRPKAGRS